MPYLPASQQLDKEVVAIPLVQQLGDEVQIRDQGRLQDDGHVAGVEELDLVVLLHAAPLLVAHWQVHVEALQVAPPTRLATLGVPPDARTEAFNLHLGEDQTQQSHQIDCLVGRPDFQDSRIDGLLAMPAAFHSQALACRSSSSISEIGVHRNSAVNHGVQ